MFALILTFPVLALLSLLYITLWAFTASAAIASAATGLALLGWEIFAMSHFAIVRIQVGDEGMTTTWRRLFQETYVPWKQSAKIKHVWGPLFVVEAPGKMAFLSWMIVGRSKEFRSELATRHVLAGAMKGEAPTRSRESG